MKPILPKSEKQFHIPKNIILALHKDLIKIYGGEQGIRSDADLEFALLKKHSFEVAEHIITNHPFIDGNKRTAIAIIMLYGLKLQPSQLLKFPVCNKILKLLGKV